jgi:hypothetical protein
VLSRVSDKWELLRYDVSMASNPQVERLMQEGVLDKAACGQVRVRLAVLCFDTHVVCIGMCWQTVDRKRACHAGLLNCSACGEKRKLP